jgi:hypothetical protein
MGVRSDPTRPGPARRVKDESSQSSFALRFCRNAPAASARLSAEEIARVLQSRQMDRMVLHYDCFVIDRG